jgi:hypothetical protein
MKISKLILAIWLAASAWAQAPPSKPLAEPHAAAKPGGGQSVLPLPKAPAPADSGKKANAAAPRNAKGKPAGHPARPPAQSSARRHGRRREAAQPLSAHKMAAANPKPAGKGKRDPFVSPIVERPRIGANCTGSGRQCLFVGDISLQGVVRDSSGYIAVVASGVHTFFLHEKDPLADGDVVRITKDAITLRQRSSDILGRPQVHEVTKKLGVPAG